MIIRRRHTANFTTIGNALFDDMRLAADELGVMAYLRSRPHDWEVRRPQLMKRFDIGRERMQRIIWSCMGAGWIVAERTRLSSGLFSTIYMVLDEPGPALSEAQVKALLTVGSTVAAEDELEESRTDHAPDHGPPHTGEPAMAEPGPGEPDTANPAWSIKNGLLNTDSPNTNPTKAAPNFSDVFAIWPRTDVLSPLVCEKAFAALSPDDRQKAFDGVGPYLANCRAKDHRLCDLKTYLQERRFEGKFSISPNATARPIVRSGTPQGMRWLSYLDATKPGSFAAAELRRGRPVTMETEWPPAIPPSPSKTG